MDSRSRKRQTSNTSLGNSDAPKAKRRKKPTKLSSQSSDLSSSSFPSSPVKSSCVSVLSRHPHPTSTTTLPLQSDTPHSDPSTLAKSTTKAATKDKSTTSSKAASKAKKHGSQSTSQGGQGSTSKTTKSKKMNPHKPVNGSWMNHIASILVYRCVGQAMARSVDPRGNLQKFKWDVLSDGLLTPDDLKMVWFFIEREYPDIALEDLSEELKAFSKLTTEPYLKEEIKEKYKGQVPKPPVSTYLLFCKSKGPKLKEKHSNLTQPQLAQKLGKKWKSMSADQQDKYKQLYSKLRKEYESKLKAFYEEHPDAKPSSYRSKRRTDSKDAYLTLEERRLKMLKAECPKPPLSAYMLFCRAKRPKVHQKHPNLSPKDVTMRLSKKWKSMGEEDKIKYKRIQLESSNLYKHQLTDFYEKYPDARELLKRKRKKKQREGSETVATQTSLRRHSSDTFSSSDDEESQNVGSKYTYPEEQSSGDKDLLDEEGEEESDDRREDNYRGTHDIRGKAETESEATSEEEEEEEEEELSVVGGGAGNRAKHSKAKLKAGSSKGKGTSSKSSPMKAGRLNARPIQQARSSTDSEEDTDLSDINFM